MTLQAGTRLGPYEIVSLLGAGAMGEVYRARDPRLGRDVALKVLPEAFAADAERVRRFEQEVRATGQLNHPNLLIVHDVGLADGTPYLVTEVLDGETLRDRLKAGPLPVSKALPYAIQILRGLAAAHARGIVHRDLKPENLFVLREGRVKILDFGIAKLTQPETAAATGAAGATVRTMTGAQDGGTDPAVVIGTMGYMSPEQVRGLPVDHRSDLFAFGAVLYEMLTGRRAFRGATPADTLTAILREEPPEMAAGEDVIPPALDRIVRHCLEKEPEARFQSASDVAFTLEALAGAARAISAPVGKRRGLLRRVVAPLFAGAALLAVGMWIGSRAVAPSGSDSTSTQKLTFQRGVLNGAGFGADDHTVYYGAEWDGGPPEVYSSDARSPGSQRSILSNARFLSVSPSNELAVLLDFRARPHNLAVGTLARVPASGGAPRKVAENVMHADWAPDGAGLAVVREVRGRWQVEYPIGRVLYTSSGWISNVGVSPDGERVAFLDHPTFPDDRGVVVMVDRKGRWRVLSEVWSSVQGLAWSPDGDEVWFTASRAGINRSLYAVGRSGRLRNVLMSPTTALLYDISQEGALLLSAERITTGMRGRYREEREERELTWLDWSVPQDLSSDCRHVLFSEQGLGGGEHYAVCIRGMDGSPPVRLGEGAVGSMSPDGAWVVAVRFWTKPPGLMLLPTGAGEPRVLPETGLENIAGACFFPDGDRLLIVGNQSGHGARGYVRRMEGGPPQPVTPEGVRVAPVSSMAISPNGVYVVGFTPNTGPILYPTGGGAPQPVRGVRPDDMPVGWSRDSRALYVSTRAGGNFPWKVDRIDLDSGGRSQVLTSEGPPDRAGVKLGIRFLGPDERSYVYAYVRTLDDLHLIRGLR